MEITRQVQGNWNVIIQYDSALHNFVAINVKIHKLDESSALLVATNEAEEFN